MKELIDIDQKYTIGPTYEVLGLISCGGLRPRLQGQIKLNSLKMIDTGFLTPYIPHVMF